MASRKPKPAERLVAAGGVVFQVQDGQIEVVLCGKTAPEQWRLPKGTPDPGETLGETALREVREETGFEVQAVDPLDHISYWFVRPGDGARCHKTVHFYLMRPIGGSSDLHDAEFDEVCWFPLDEALQRLAFREECRMVEEAARLVLERDYEQH